MKRSLAFPALAFLVSVVMSLGILVLPSSTVAEGTGGDPPPPFPPTDTTITVSVVPDEPPDTQVASEEQSLWDEILSLFTF